MLHKNAHSGNGIYEIPIPKNANFLGPLADQMAILAYRILLLTSQREEYFERGFFIPFSKEQGRRVVGYLWPDTKREILANYSHVFEFNERYSYRDGGDGFPKSIRLHSDYRSGEVELHRLKKPLPAASMLNIQELDLSSRKLVEDFQHFYLPEATPSFENAWQAFTWSRISCRDYHAGRCRFGRFHSNYTAFKHRNALQCDGGASAIDIVACQPLILGGCVLEHFGGLPDVIKWLSLCSGSDPYQHVAELGGLDRQTAKQELIQCIFERHKQMQNMRIFAILQAEFPTIAKFLLELKADGEYQRVARLCQSKESRLLITQSIKDLAQVPVITVHDEFIVPKRHKDKVIKVITKRFQAVGLSPRFTVTEQAT